MVCLYSLNMFAQEGIVVKSKISKATLFLEGAQVFRSSTVDLKKGNNKFIFRELSDHIIPKSVQATSADSYIILDVTHGINYFVPEAIKPQKLSPKVIAEMKTLNDSLFILKLATEQNNQKLIHLQGEKDMIITNNLMVNNGINDTLPILKEVIQYYRIKLDEIDGEMYKFKIKQNQLCLNTERINSRLMELKNYEIQITTPKTANTEAQNEIVVTVFSEKEIKGAKMEINYVITDAGWSPAYDLRSNGTDEAIALTYKANIYQASGMDWENIPIKLSTFNPTNCNLKPELPVWDVSKPIYRPNISFNKKYKEHTEYENIKSAAPTSMSNAMLELNEADALWKNEAITKVEIDKHPSFTNVEFDIELPCTLKSSDKSILIFVSQTTINAVYQRYAVPKLDKQSYIVAKIGGWENLNLLNGPVNIYFKNTYMGETLIDVWKPTDSLQISLGRNQSVIAVRKKIKDETKNIALSNLKSREMTIEITLKNINNNSEEVIIQDQQPISTSEKYKIKLTESAGAKLNANTGSLEWKIVMKAKETKTLTFTYIIECEKDAVIE